MLPLSQVGVVVCNVLVVGLLGWITRGWVLRVGGALLMLLAAFFMVMGVVTGGLFGYLLAAMLPGLFGLVLWVAGHMLFARVHGRYKSVLARRIVWSVTGRMLRWHARREVRAGRLAS